MNKNITRFLSSVLVLCIYGTVAAHAAPTVRKLGTNTARVGANTTVVNAESKQNVTTTQRLGSVRAKPIAAAPAVNTTKVINTTPNTVKEDDSRLSLSLGNYVHTFNSASGNIQGASVAPITSSADFINLVDRVSNLETDIELKQNTISVGNGLSLENNTIVLDSDITDLPTQVGSLQNEMNTKVSITNLEANYYNKEEVDGLVESYIGSDVNTIYDSATRQRKYVSIVDTFDEKILN